MLLGATCAGFAPENIVIVTGTNELEIIFFLQIISMF